MFEVTIVTGSTRRTVSAAPGQLIGDLLRQYIPSFALPCAGNHTCGKCRVQVSGPASPAGEEETRLLPPDALARGMRLACSCRVMGDLSVTLREEGASRIVTWHKTPDVARTGTGYGFAVDIGTTTVALQLVDRASGAILAERLAENAQRGYGADVISRIEACKTAGLDTLSNRIADQLEEMAGSCLRETGIKAVDESVVTGNTTMLHLYEGLDPSSLAVVPFDVQSHFGYISRRRLAGAPVYLPRCTGAYVGADITCAILSANLTGGGIQLLADIGTNGEMVLGCGSRLLCCATAAGPAFEGAGLSCGMPAVPGAIRAVARKDGGTVYEAVPGRPAAGVCGSGILDALAVMLETGAIDETGYLEESWPVGDSGVSITQRDVRQIQLAKSAVCAGLITLLEHEHISAKAVSRFAIAGGFGSSMNADSAVRIGLFPADLRQKTDFIGNGALGGAYMLLLNRDLRAQSEVLVRNAVELSLSSSPEFMDYYVDCMSFGEF
nr:ASKHA domain-containing protein [uncultured Oscillibacter sp.]